MDSVNFTQPEMSQQDQDKREAAIKKRVLDSIQDLNKVWWKPVVGSSVALCDAYQPIYKEVEKVIRAEFDVKGDNCQVSETESEESSDYSSEESESSEESSDGEKPAKRLKKK